MPEIKAQRGIGILYFSFASWVFVSVMIDRALLLRPFFVPYDVITIACIGVFFISIFIESKLMKVLQVIMILIVAFAILTQANYYLSLALFTNVFFIMYTYGFFTRYTKIKITLSIIFVYTLFILASSEASSGFISMINWLVFIVVHILSIWIVFRATVNKANQYEASKEMQLMNKIDEITAELYKTREHLDRTQSQLGDAVISGIELLDIIKEMKDGK